MTAEQQKFLDQVTEAGMSLADVRAFKKDLALGDTITPAEWMKAKELPEVEREKARNTRISETNKKAGLDQYLTDKFDTPGRKPPEHPLSPTSQMKRVKPKT